jgi:putative DNA primase/helicase
MTSDDIKRLRTSLRIGEGERLELSAKVGRSFSGETFTDDHAAAAAWASRQPCDVYFGTNPIALNARLPKGRASDEDVARVQDLLIDADPDDSTPESCQKARELASDVRTFILHKLGVWPAVIFSGRGVQLHLRHEQAPPDDARLELRKRLTHLLARKFDRPGAHVDLKTHNHSRLARLPGTVNSKTGAVAAWLDQGEDVATLAEIAALVAELETQFPAPKFEALSPRAESWPEHYVATAINGEIVKLRSAKEGARNNTLNEAAFALGTLAGGGADIGDGIDRLREAARQSGLDDSREVESTLQSGYNAGLKSPRKPPEKIGLTDLGNARRLIRKHGARLRYSGPLGWLIFDGKRWVRDETETVVHLARDVSRELFAEAAKAETRAASGKSSNPAKTRMRANALRKHAERSEGEPSIRRLVALARSEPGVSVRVDELDRNPWLLTVENGTIDLKTGTLGPHCREDLVTKVSPVAFDPDAKAPLWGKFLETVTGRDCALADYLRRVAGYCLVGDAREQCFFLFHGTGQNGKSTFISVLGSLLGEHAVAAQFSSFIAAKNGNGYGPRGDIARLRGARMVSAVETEETGTLAMGILKQLSGGDAVTAAFKFKDEFSFVPTFKIVLAANERPTIRSNDKATWRRIKLVPWAVTIPDREKDPDLPKKLLAEGPGILAWAVQGCLDWQRSGLQEPLTVTRATGDYRADEDDFGSFVQEECALEAESNASARELFEAYVAFTKARGGDPISEKKFSAKLQGLGLIKRHTRSGARWTGVALRPAPAPPTTGAA